MLHMTILRVEHQKGVSDILGEMENTIYCIFIYKILDILSQLVPKGSNSTYATIPVKTCIVSKVCSYHKSQMADTTCNLMSVRCCLLACSDQ